VPDAVITVICAPDNGWSYHPKQVERAVYRNIINCTYSQPVGQLLTFKVAITEEYPWIPWDLIAGTLGSAEHNLGNTDFGSTGKKFPN